MPVTVAGIPQAKAHLATVAAELANPAHAHAATAQLIAAATHPPRRTGRLAASVRPFPGRGARVGSDVPYAALVESRTHFLARAVQDTRAQWMAVYHQAAVDACRGH